VTLATGADCASVVVHRYKSLCFATQVTAHRTVVMMLCRKHHLTRNGTRRIRIRLFEKDDVDEQLELPVTPLFITHLVCPVLHMANQLPIR
jgi:hypothetical protein